MHSQNQQESANVARRSNRSKPALNYSEYDDESIETFKSLLDASLKPLIESIEDMNARMLTIDEKLNLFTTEINKKN